MKVRVLINFVDEDEDHDELGFQLTIPEGTDHYRNGEELVFDSGRMMVEVRVTRVRHYYADSDGTEAESAPQVETVLEAAHPAGRHALRVSKAALRAHLSLFPGVAEFD